uniref:AlNc14C71G4871 protein n=1 Tax=Albugo laibachii Nc14 TaxID=890382 RepID=F0WE05_9STRA|nr:AlNc14C71G4871 [Albugo laibachii Nc14]|eukprot:CCA19434.1 AlNc14C71G4871 [Albugo laibachii Nc14]
MVLPFYSLLFRICISESVDFCYERAIPMVANQLYLCDASQLAPHQCTLDKHPQRCQRRMYQKLSQHFPRQAHLTFCVMLTVMLLSKTPLMIQL